MMSLKRFVFPSLMVILTTIVLVSSGTILYDNGRDAGYYARALEQEQAVKEAEDRCQSRVERWHQLEQNLCDARLLQMRTQLNSTHAPIACELRDPSQANGD